MSFVLYENPDDFFSAEKRTWMLFSRSATKAIIEQAASRGWEILRYEGGIYKDGTFEGRIDAIWDRLYLHVGREFLEAGNLRAIEPLMEEPPEYNAFIIMARPLPEPEC